MTIALTAALILTVFAAFWALDRRDARSKLERDADRDERQTLLQRIQAPQSAVVEHSMRDVPEDGSGLPYTDEELAEREERERVLSFIERVENGAG